MKRLKLITFSILNLLVSSTILAHGHGEHHHFHWDDVLMGLMLIALIFVLWTIFLKKKKSD